VSRMSGVAPVGQGGGVTVGDLCLMLGLYVVLPCVVLCLAEHVTVWYVRRVLRRAGGRRAQ